MYDFHNKTVFITGGTRGIGRAIALKMAARGANVAIAAKTKEPHPHLKGTLDDVVKEIETLGGKGLGLQTDVRFEEQIQAAVQATVDTFGGIDMVVNNAGAIYLTNTLETTLARFDLMMGVNVRATFATVQASVPHLAKADNPHILMLSPPLSLKPAWLKNHCAYTLSKYGMSLCVIGMAEEFRSLGIAVNALWPRTTIATAAVERLGGEPLLKASRKPDIMADAAYYIFQHQNLALTGQCLIDETLLKTTGADLEAYAVVPGAPLYPDFFID